MKKILTLNEAIIKIIKALHFIAKGQLISKGLFGFSILPKNELENVNFCPSLLGKKCFFHFLGELKKPKSPFEIN